MTTQPQLDRKVRHLDNDVASIYEILARIELKQGRHDNRFEEIGADLDGLKSDVSGIKTEVSGIKTEVSGIKSDVSGIKTEVSSLAVQMSEVLGILRSR